MVLPNSVILFGMPYMVEYKDTPSDVDINKRNSLWGQIDYWAHSIRIFRDKDTPVERVFQCLLHEILHVIGEDSHMSMLQDDANHLALDNLATHLMDIFVRNSWVTLEYPKDPKSTSTAVKSTKRPLKGETKC